MTQDLLLQRVAQAVQQGDWPALRAACEAALALRPQDAALWLRLSEARSGLGHYRAAREAALRSLSHAGAELRMAAPLASRLRLFNEGRSLRELLRRLPPPAQLPLPLLLSLAAQTNYLNLHEDALRLLDEARRADPNYPPTLVSRAQVLIYAGRFAEARADLQRCLRRAPELAQAWWLLAHVSEAAARPGQVDALRRRLVPGLPPRDAAMLHYALHLQLDALGDVAGAWEALDAGCAAMRAVLRGDVAESRRLVDALVQAPIRLPQQPAGEAGPVPVFIVGMHRSGTTLLEQLLSGHGQVAALGELYDFTSQMRLATDHHCRGPIDLPMVARAGAADLGAVGRGYLASVAWRLGAATHFTDKLPSNFFNAGWIAQALPQARILHMVRDPMETCFSNLRELFADVNPWSYDQQALGEHFLQYRRLAGHWREHLPGRVLDVDYARLTREPEAVMREVSAFCGLPFDPAMLEARHQRRAVGTASAVQVRERVHAREVPKWQPYAQYLGPLRAVLGA